MSDGGTQIPPSGRLRAWTDTWIGGARLHQTAEPVYANPGELKDDLRVVLDALERVRNEAPDYIKALVRDV